MKTIQVYCLFFLSWLLSLIGRVEGLQNDTLSQGSFSAPCQEKKSSIKDDIFIVLLIIIFVVGFLGNTAAIATIVFSKRLRAVPTNIFVAALALCDIGAILFIIPIRPDTYLYERNFCFDIHVCQMFNLSDSLFHIGSMSHLFIIALERYFAVNHPFVHQRTMSRGKTMVGILLTWLYSAFWTCLSLFNWKHPSKPTIYFYAGQGKRLCWLVNPIFYNVIYIVVYVIPLAVMGVIYSVIWRVALKQAQIIESLLINPDRSGIKKHRREVRATKTLAIVYGAFTFCWLPLAIIGITSQWFPKSYTSFVASQPILAEVILALFIEVLPTLNSCLNPFIYILFNKKFREEIKISWHKLRCSAQKTQQLINMTEMSEKKTLNFNS